MERDEQPRPVLLRAGALLELRDLGRRGSEGAAIDPELDPVAARDPGEVFAPGGGCGRNGVGQGRLAPVGLAGMVERRREVDGERRPLRGFVRGGPDRLLEANERLRIGAAVEQASRLLGEKPRLEPVVAGAEDRRSERGIHGVLGLEVAGERVDLGPHQRRLDALAEFQRPGSVRLVEPLEGAIAPAFAREPDRLQTQGPHRFPGRRFRMIRPPRDRPASKVDRVSEQDGDLDQAKAGPALRPGVRRGIADDPFEPRLRLRRAATRDLALGLQRGEPGREILAALRGQARRDREPRLGTRPGNALDP